MNVREVTHKDIPDLVALTRRVYGGYVRTSDDALAKWADLYIRALRMGFFRTDHGFIVGTFQAFTHEGERRTIVNHLAVEGRGWDAVYLCRALLDWTKTRNGLGIVLSARIDNSIDLTPLARRLGGRMVPTWLVGQ